MCDVGRRDVHCASAAGSEVAHARRDGVKGMQRLAKCGQRQGLHVPFDVCVGLLGAAAGEAAEGGRRHRHWTPALQRELQTHHYAGERVAVEAVHRAVRAALGDEQCVVERRSEV